MGSFLMCVQCKNTLNKTPLLLLPVHTELTIHTDMCMLERSDVVGSVSAHEREESELFERRDDILLLFGGHPSVHPNARKHTLKEAAVMLG